MNQKVQSTFNKLAHLSNTADLLAAALKVDTAGDYLPGNSHIHLPPNFSAFDTIKQAVSLAQQQGLGVLGASNYYDYSVYGEFGELALAAKIYPLFGLEIICLLPDLQAQGIKINDPGNPGKLYLCGKGITKFDPFTDTGLSLISEIRSNDSTRIRAMIEALDQYCTLHGIATKLTESTVITGIVKRHGCPPESVYLQERHIAQAFQEAIFTHTSNSDRLAKLQQLFGVPSKSTGQWNASDAVTVQNEIRSYLMKSGKPGYVKETFISWNKAYRLILELGGIPCYPTLADGNNPICQFEETPEKLISQLKSMGIYAVELVPNRNSVEVLRKYVHAFRYAGLVVTAGTEHNSLDLIPLEPTCKGGVPIPDDLKQIFWEGSCVIAAHQYLSLNHLPGFVDGIGQLVAGGIGAYTSDNDRITKLAQIGAMVISRFH